ncbi:MAG: TIGR03905 family TSCPD domain-containing protein [Bacteroidales bacterium]|nr:TIGR03905 family TSCPD domain-containing protein [Bacteroidales bacterium]
MKVIDYPAQGTCSKLIRVAGENGRVVDAQVLGGCHGNLQGICALIKGQTYDEVIARLEGIKCGMKSTSCPDQIALALRQLKKEDA